MTQTSIAIDSPEYNAAPASIRALIFQAVEIGGEVTSPQPRRYEFALPMRIVGGGQRLVKRAAVGYYVKDGKNVIGGTHGARAEIAYWGNQSGNA